MGLFNSKSRYGQTDGDRAWTELKKGPNAVWDLNLNGVVTVDLVPGSDRYRTDYRDLAEAEQALSRKGLSLGEWQDVYDGVRIAEVFGV